MERRTYLQALGAAGTVGLAGCLDDAMGVVGLGDDGTVLGPPEQSRGDPDVAAYPVHGEEFPAFSLPDPLADETITRDQFAGERAIVMTYFFTSCPDGACPALMTRLRRIQEDAAQQGYADDIALLAMTFDPERDTPDVLADYAAEQGVDHEADNWHFLRPETNEAARDAADTFGLGLQRIEDGEPGAGGGHGGAGNESDGHEGNESGHDDHDHGEYTFQHINLILLANKEGVVERSYPQALNTDMAGIEDIVDDARTVARE
ncbi:SCO family protein [Halopiger aswanensis]|uniref:Protein SCO1/2 n=1 Tax=Halopiger aswanensis TaxID=148449 RepID=A0A419WPE2_9EURY|nr:SCO family protein [Halopiger aswanensis]RKD97322.1 protein SCO1/2 [Halopiger aswanensis]